MSYLSAVFVGIVFGASEIFPISGAAHLSILQHFFGLTVEVGSNPFFAFLLRFAVLCAAAFVYRRELVMMLFSVRLPSSRKGRVNGAVVSNKRFALLLLVGTLPLLLAIPFRAQLRRLEDMTLFIGASLIATGVLLTVCGRTAHGNKTERNASVPDALLIGLAQVVSVLPGISRTAVTVSAGQLRGFRKSFSVDYSFLLFVPAMLFSNLLTLIDAFSVGIDFSMLPKYIVGMLAAAAAGYLAASLMKTYSERLSFEGFSFYCWCAGIVTLILSLIE